MRKIFAYVATAVLATVGVVGVTQTPALAAWSSCPLEAVCLYGQTGGGGVPDIYTMPTLGCRNTYAGGGNWARSAWNRTGEPVWLRDGSNCTGAEYAIADTWKVSDLGSFNLRTSSSQTR